MAQQRPRKKINLISKTDDDASTRRNPRAANFNEDLDEFEGLREELFNARGEMVAVDDGKKIKRVPQKNDDLELATSFSELEEALALAEKIERTSAKSRRKERDNRRKAVRKVNKTSLIPVVYNHLSYRAIDQELRQEEVRSRQRHDQLLSGIEIAINSQVAMVVAARVEQKHRTLNNGFEQEDYDLANDRQESEREFDQLIELKPSLVEHDHQLNLKKQDHTSEMELTKLNADTGITMAKLEVEQRAAERGDVASEADKNRDHDMVLQTIAMGQMVYDTMIEIRLNKQSQPTEVLAAAMGVMQSGMVAYSKMFEDMDPKERALLAPSAQKTMASAVNQVMQMLNRGPKSPPTVTANPS